MSVGKSIPKSILKPATPSNSLSPSSKEDRNLEIALHHAGLLQQRKDVQAQILAATEILLDIPTSSNADPARPSQGDASTVINSLQDFQPADYDVLIEERNINRQCGYVLCPRPNRHQETNAKYRIIHGKGRGADAMKFVETNSLEKWCSDECEKRGLYIKLQLVEEPAWTRTSSPKGEIVLLQDVYTDEANSQDEIGLLESMKDLDISLGEEKLVASMKALAIERGDASAPSRSFGLAEIQEKYPIEVQRDPGHLQEFEPHNAIEGYCPHFGGQPMRQKDLDSDQEDMMRTI